MGTLFILLQRLLPQHFLSRRILWLTRLEWPWLKSLLIRSFCAGFKPDLRDAAEPRATAYPSFNAFFTRALKPGARPLATAEVLSPVDGCVSEAGRIEAGQLLQAKGHCYSLESLLAGAATDWAPRFRDGHFATLYLAPTDYHRIHMPCAGVLKEAWFVPGDLFSVNATTARLLPGLFARNERVVLLFEGPVGPFAVVLVGALFVGSMSTVWHGDVAPAARREPTRLPLEGLRADLALAQGAELGRFNMGSTVILLYPAGSIGWRANVVAGERLRVGEAIGERGGAHGR
ncbi:MAG: phosphatidylserine decarboxylase [Pseudomonadota bacterium]